MNHEPDNPHRRSIRLSGYDYAHVGGYFITICTHDRKPFFGNIDTSTWEMSLNQTGEIALQCWKEIPNHFSHVELDEFVIMPNHIHGILMLAALTTTFDKSP